MAHRTGTGLAASRLRITNIPGTTQVRLAPGAQAGMNIELSGPEALVRDISWDARNGTLHVTGPADGGGNVMISTSGPGYRTTVRGRRGGVMISGRDIVIGGRGGMSVSSAGGQTVISTGGRGGTVIVDGKIVSGPGAGEPAEAGEVTLVVSIPEGTPVQISDNGAGNYELGDLRGPLDLRIGGHSQIRAGAVRATQISVGGSAGIEIASVLDELRTDIAGSGQVDVRAGEVASLRLSVSGSGRIGFAGTALNAALDISGSGRIRVDTVTGSLRKNVSGSGRIDIREQPRRNKDDFWT